MKDLISVVIPIYNVEKYLDRCIRSVVDQTYRNLQIILIDDGSTDACPQICDEWVRRDDRITVIHKKNTGLGAARNTGIDHAKGKYICFFDSDDFADTAILEKAYELSERTQSDLTIFGLASADEEGNIRETFIPQTPKHVFEGDEVQKLVLPDLIHSGNDDAKCRNLSFSVCVCLFRAELIRKTNWRMVSEREIISEDSYSLMVLYQSLRRVAVLPEVGYYYCHHQNSLSHRFRTDRFEKIKQFYTKSIELQQKLGYSEAVAERLARLFLAFAVETMKQLAGSEMPASRKLKMMKEIVCDRLVQRILHSLTIGCYNRKIRLLFCLMRCRLHRIVYYLVRIQVARAG